MNSYYANLSVMGLTKPFFFPPPDLGMVESMGSYENTSRFFRSVKSNNNRSFGKNSSVIGVAIKNKTNIPQGPEQEVPLKSQYTNQDDGQESIGNSARKSAHQPEISIESLDSVESNFSDPDKYRDDNSEKDNENMKIQTNDACIGPLTTDEIDPSIEDENAENLSVESYYVLEDLSREGLQKYLKESMLVFNEMYSIDKKKIEFDVQIVPPSFDLCYKYLKMVITSSKMEKEIPLISLVYLERLLLRTGILMNGHNWRRLMLTTMIIASKLWDDDSLENEHFPSVMKDVTIKEINNFERVFLDLIGYDLTVSGTEYAKYYFILRTIADFNQIEFPYKDIPVSKMLELHNEEGAKIEEIKELSKNVVNLEHSI
jgi:hypothetical protein